VAVPSRPGRAIAQAPRAPPSRGGSSPGWEERATRESLALSSRGMCQACFWSRLRPLLAESANRRAKKKCRLGLRRRF
jgi:hypothetical protein